MRGFAVTLTLVALLVGCSSPGSLLESKKIDYKSAGKLPSLEVPPDLTRPSRDERYVVPDLAPRGSATYSAYAGERAAQPAASSGPEVLSEVGAMRIERAGTQRWLVVPQSAEQLWPAVKAFWQNLGFIVSIEMPEVGVMETDWAENRAKIPQDFIRGLLSKVLDSVYSTAERDRFRVRFEKGAQPGTTEIYISHRGMIEVYTTADRTDTRWQPRPPDAELEAEMLRRLMVHLGVEEARAASMLANAAPAVERARLVQQADGASALRVQEAFDRAWRRVGLALDRIGFTVEDRDRAGGLYFVRYADPESQGRKKGEKGWLDRLMFWKGESPATAVDLQYRVHVAAEGEDSVVRVLTREGGVDRSETSRRILSLLHEQLK